MTRRMNPPLPAEGDLVFVQGHQFKATNVRLYPEYDIKEQPTGRMIMRFTGVCTDSPVNDSIRNLGYNGGSYGWGDW